MRVFGNPFNLKSGASTIPAIYGYSHFRIEFTDSKVTICLCNVSNNATGQKRNAR